MDHFLGLYPRLGWFAPLVLGRGGGESTPMDANGGGRCGWALTDLSRVDVCWVTVFLRRGR